jgi:aryl-alcohol dehydrogenase
MSGSTDILAAVFREGSQDARTEHMQMGDLREDEVLVRVVGAGICHTDLTCRSGFMTLPRPIILGHEGSGIVERVGSAVTSVVPGDPVVMTFLSCGACPRCESGESSYCFHFMQKNLSGRRADGSTALTNGDGEVAAHFFGQSSFASHSVANQRNVVKVRADAPLELLGPLGCGVQTGAGSVMNVLRPKPGDALCVFGAGGVGLSAVMAAVVEGCAPIIVVEPNAARRTLALELGAHHAIDPTTETDLVAKLKSITGGIGINHAVDTCGIPAVISQGLSALAPRGQIVLLTGASMEASVPLPLLPMLSLGVRIHCVNEGSSEPQTFIPRLVDLIMEGRFPLDRLVKYYPFAEINLALEDQEHGKAIKPILRLQAA